MGEHTVRGIPVTVSTNKCTDEEAIDYIKDALDITDTLGWEYDLTAIKVGRFNLPLRYSAAYNKPGKYIIILGEYIADDFTLLHELTHAAHINMYDSILEMDEYKQRWKDNITELTAVASTYMRLYSVDTYYETVADIASYYLSARTDLPEYVFEYYEMLGGPPLR